ncbi:MAG: protein kinase [Myxococcota bacterium]
MPLRCPTCGERTLGQSGDRCKRDGARLLPRAADPLLGEVLGGAYRIAAPLARGGMGLIYRGRHVRLERDVAVKVLSPSFAKNELALRRFYREVEALARVRSPHVVHVLDAVQGEDGRPCLVTELLEGEDLQKRLTREGTLPLIDALEIALQLADALIAVHDEGVLHRDLKPSNVFLCHREGPARGDEESEASRFKAHVRLLDFGVARVESEPHLTRDGAVVGTPAYMAPEQVRGAKNASIRGDVYGVGAILYRALTGVAPYSAGPATQVLAAVLDGPPKAPSLHTPTLPIDVEALILRAMAREPDDRFANARVLRQALKELLIRHGSKVPWSTRGRGTALAAAAAVGTSLALLAAPLMPPVLELYGPLALGVVSFAGLRKLDAADLRPLLLGAVAALAIVGAAACATLSLTATLPVALSLAALVGLSQWRRSKRSAPESSTQAECTQSTMTPSSSLSRPASQRTPARART